MTDSASTIRQLLNALQRRRSLQEACLLQPWRTVLCIGVLTAVVGCASGPPVTYYTLAPTDRGIADGRSSDATRPISAVVAVGPVELPEYLERPYIVVREGPYVVRPSAAEQWAAPLDDMLPRVLIEDLAARLPFDRVVAFPLVAAPTLDYRIAIDISRFDVDSTGQATLVADWQIYERTAASALQVTRDSFRRLAEGSGYASHVAALSAVLGDLSERLASDLAVVRNTSAPRTLSGR